MDGYSVNEAAAVLGIPEGRVWELLARGVLSGSTEVGGEMRVFLRGTAVPEAAPHRGNGNGGNGGGGELTPFRELLTEFRNLTERYGQALLALGEARGEVASLRGRVDLLEARLDSRSPWPAAAPATWSDLPEPPAALGQMPGAPRGAASEPDLFAGCAWVLCLEPHETSLADWLTLARLYTAMGARVVPVTAAEHDTEVFADPRGIEIDRARELERRMVRGEPGDLLTDLSQPDGHAAHRESPRRAFPYRSRLRLPHRTGRCDSNSG